MADAHNGGGDHTAAQKSTSANRKGAAANGAKPPSNKRQLSKETRKKRSDLAGELARMSDRKAKLRSLSIDEVEALLGRSAKTLEKDRAELRAAKAEGRTLPPNHPAALKFEQSTDGGPVKYIAAHVIEHLLAQFEAAENSGAKPPLAARGFQGWLAEATAMEKWPFTIREDGRPVDMLSALKNGATTGNAKALTPKEFAGRFAKAALASFHRKEAQGLGLEVPEAIGGQRRRRDHP